MNTPLPLTNGDATCWLADAVLPCGFPSPAEDHVQRRIDLNDILLRHPDATFYMRVRGTSMHEAGIDDGDCVIIDRAITASHGDIVVAVVDGEFTIKRLYRRDGKVALQPANAVFSEIVLQDGQELQVWGVVTWVIKQIHRKSASR